MEEKMRSKLDLISTDLKFKFQGLVIPFDEGDDNDPSMIIQIIPELTIPFDTKKRAPFRMVCETVKLSELLQIQKR